MSNFSREYKKETISASERHLYEQIIKQQKEQLAAIVNGISDGLFLLGSNNKFTFLNEAAKDFFYQPELINKKGDSFRHTKYYDAQGKPLTVEEMAAPRVLKGQVIKNEIIELKRPDGVIYFSLSGNPIYDENGNIVSALICSRDITQQKKAEKVVYESEKIYKTLFNSIDEGFCIVEMVFDAQGVPVDYLFIETNHTFENQTGLFEAKGKFMRSLAPDHEDHWYQIYGKVATTGEPIRFTNVAKALNRWYDVYAFPTGDTGSNRVGILFNDITERKQIEEKIRWDKQRAEILWEVAEKLHASAHPQEAITELCTKVMEFLGCHVFFNYLIDEDKMQLHLNSCAGITAEHAKKIEYLEMGSAVCGCVARDGCRIVAENIQSITDPRTELIKSFGIRAYACHPLTEPQLIIGTLSFGTKSRDAFHEDELSLIREVANQISIAMSRIRTARILRKQQQMMIQAEREKNEALEASMRQKDEFLYLITHEFRTPMAVINSALQAIHLIYGKDVTENIGKHLKTIKQNTNRQLRLVNNLLDITRMTSNHAKLNSQYFDIVYVTKSIVSSVQLYASQKDIQLHFTSSIAELFIFLDEEKFERILLNLLANALKFTPKGKSITVSMAPATQKGKDAVSISVQDEGIGIPKEKQKIIFEKFGQADTSLSRQAEGTGLGLHLVNLIVRALAGEIILESDEGRGSTFTVILPTLESSALNEELPCAEANNNFVNQDERIVQATSIELSDIYFD